MPEASYGGGTVMTMVVHGEWWLLTNSPTQYGLLAVVVAFVLALRFFRRSHDVTVRERGLSHHRMLAPGVEILCPDLMGLDRRHRIRSEWRADSLSWSPCHGGYDHLPVHQARWDLDGVKPCSVT
jgi:hypothetical protein